jgi:hypothetical protein
MGIRTKLCSIHAGCRTILGVLFYVLRFLEGMSFLARIVEQGKASANATKKHSKIDPYPRFS